MNNIKQVTNADVLGLVSVCVQEMMYIWNGYTVIGKHKDLTENMLKTLDEAQAQLESSTSRIPLRLRHIPPHVGEC